MIARNETARGGLYLISVFRNSTFLDTLDRRPILLRRQYTGIFNRTALQLPLLVYAPLCRTALFRSSLSILPLGNRDANGDTIEQMGPSFGTRERERERERETRAAVLRY